MCVQRLIGTKRGLQLGLFIGRHMSRRAGYGVARFVASNTVRRKQEGYWTVRANLAQVVGPDVDDDELHELTRRVFFHAGQTYYDAFHALEQPADVLARTVQGMDRVVAQIESQTTQGRGVLLMGTHTSNFDLGMMVLGAYRLPIQGLSLADPRAGDQVLNNLRTRAGVHITPITPESLRAAIRRLKEGGVVMTGADRPAPRKRDLIEFFDRPSYLPLGPVRLALMSGAAAMVGGCHHHPDRGYTLKFSDPIEMERTGEQKQDILANARRVAAIMEEYVRMYPEQWLMFHRIWPESSPV